jgi:hypothetical protein
MRKYVLGLVGVLALTLSVGCGRDDRTTTTGTGITTADREADQQWMRERDDYIRERRTQLDDYDRRWQEHQPRATARDRQLWQETEQERTTLRRELDEAGNATREAWDDTRRRLDEGWNRFETRTREMFDRDDTRQQRR